MSVPPQYFGISRETESSWENFLSETHRLFVLEYLERTQAHEEAVLSQFLAAKER
jgi:hypothetical protein